jgi:TolB-like protein/class 3 adenylate cyclase
MEMQRYERRLVTIISADVIGYSRLMETDEDATVATLKSYLSVIDENVQNHRGRVFGMAGDSLMAEFACPIEAVRCAAEIQRQIEHRNQNLPDDRQLRFRIGINTGDVIAIGSDLYGDDINIAARLQEISSAGAIVVSETVCAHVAGKINLGFRDLGQQRLKNITLPVRAYKAEVTSNKDFDRTNLTIETAAPVPGFDGRPALAVLPFKNLSRDTENTYIADGLTEDLIKALSNLRWFPVIARNSSFAFRDSTVDMVRIGRALGAKYLLSGSVRFVDDRLRVLARLVDAQTGVNLWNQRYDRELSNIFEVQDDITASIVSSLDAEIDLAEQLRSHARHPEHLDTWGLVRRGMWHQHLLTGHDAAEARRLFEEALRRSPTSVEALIQLAWWHFWEAWTQRTATGLVEMERLARLALVKEPRDARAHMLLGIVQIMTRKPQVARVYLSDAVRLNPSLATAHACIGSAFILEGEPQKAVEALFLALRLNPHDLFGFHLLGEFAVAHHLRKDWDQALEFSRRSLQLRPGYWYARVVRIATLARRDELQSANEALVEVKMRHPNFSIDHVRWLPFVDAKWNDYLIEGLKLAGLDGAT